MKNQPTPRPSLLRRRVLGALAIVAALVLPVIVVGAVGIFLAQTLLYQQTTQRFSDPALQPPAHDPAKPTVAILASNQGTEISDFLAPYAVFSAADAFNVYAVAPEREFAPFMWGGLDIMPHYSFAELDNLLGTDPDVIVIPFFKDPENPAIVQWVRDHAGPDTLVVSICAGAHTLAATGLVDGGKMTTHQSYFSIIEKNYPQIELVRNVRYVDNGSTITSAGITAGIDASLYAIQKLLGKQAALDVAGELNYPHVRFLDNPLYQVPTFGASGFLQVLNAAFHWNRDEIGVYLFEGVNELDLTATLDTYGSSFTARASTFAPAREVIRSANGLYLVPRADFESAGPFDRILVPGDQSAPVQSLPAWMESGQHPAVEYLYKAEQGNGEHRPFAYDITLTDLAQRSSEVDAQMSLASLEYPAEHLQLGGRSWPLQRLTPALLILAAGLATLWLLQQRGRTRGRTSPTVANPVSA